MSINASVGVPVNPKFGGGYNVCEGLKIETYPTYKAIHLATKGETEIDIALDIESAVLLVRQLSDQINSHHKHVALVDSVMSKWGAK